MYEGDEEYEEYHEYYVLYGDEREGDSCDCDSDDGNAV